MKREISTVFSKPFNLSPDDIGEGKCFQFDYLQRTGAGSHTLCMPTVTPSFEWSGRQVATLAKSGGCIYILATEDIPVFGESAVSVLFLVTDDFTILLNVNPFCRIV